MQAGTEKAERQTFGRYQTLFRIAGGGMAEVYAARALGEGGFQKLVALKRMLPHLAEDDRFVTMFLDEGRLAAHISSPNVVQTLDLGSADDGSLYLVMELVRGASLANLLHNVRKQGEQLPVGLTAEVIAQAAQGLHDAHNATTPMGEPLQLVHRDVSPQNILVGSDGRARITDFGVARAVQRRTQTQTGELKGKFSYFAPEQVTTSDLDLRVDVFALGVIAWESFTGRRLFAGDNPLMQLDRVKNMPIPPVTQLRPEVPEEIAQVVAQALERDRDQRIRTAGDLAHKLREAARAAGVALPPPSEIGEFVQARGGKAAQRLEASLKRAFSGETELPEELDQPLADKQSDSHSGVVGGSWGRDLSPGTAQLNTDMLQQMDAGDAAATTARPGSSPSTPGTPAPGTPAPGMPAPGGGTAGATPSVSPTPSTMPASEKQPGRKRGVLVAVVAAAVALGGAGAGAWALIGPGSSADTEGGAVPAVGASPQSPASDSADEDAAPEQHTAEQRAEAAEDEDEGEPSEDEQTAAPAVDEEGSQAEAKRQAEARRRARDRRRASSGSSSDESARESDEERARRAREAMLRRERQRERESSGAGGSGSAGSDSGGSSGSSSRSGSRDSSDDTPGPGLVGVDAFDEDLKGN